MSKVFGGAMCKTLALAAALFTFTAANLHQVPLGSMPFPADHEFTTQWDEEACTISRSTAFEVLDGPNTFNTAPSEPINSVKITPAINKTNWEQWEFDGLSHTGLSFIMVLFSRDYSYYFFGKGNLRVEVFMTLPDGRKVQELDYVKESTVIDCPGYTAGIWNTSSRSYSFYTSKDLKYTKVDFDSPKIRGTYKLSATTPPHHADGSAWDPEAGKSAEDAALISPDFYYSVPVAGGVAEVDAVLGSGKKLSFSGRGGSTRLWAQQGWLGFCESWVAVRAWAGPYTFTYWEIVSRVGAYTGKKFVSGHLFYNDQPLAGTRVDGNASDTAAAEDSVRITHNYDGEIAGTLIDKNTGHVIEFASPSRDKKWRFELQHTMKQYELPVGGGLGMSDFANRVFGGDVEGNQYEGRGLTEQAVFPAYVPQWAVWLLYGVGFLGTGKDYAVDFVNYLFS
ncbi:uncharacterized protein N7484_009321 [Penicillium longicatenatum]|uniref:uncharacterized protein n=1 Tax=Penicillium longicatenatum TaxID=1561947 RepID=UPI002547D7BD|nr:uncharacterized protein N7484_009321 [Penicillium longicatenatum]KAJ5636008.1 hypothetical protein N7484_009321 [Penicillium longicatenatum]